MYCPNCGEILAEEARVCSACGVARIGAAVDYPSEWPAFTHPELSSPALTAELLAVTHESGESWNDGGSRDYYLPKWRPTLEGRASWQGFNFAAAFFGMNWCFWRRLYLLGVGLAVAEIAGVFLLSVILVIATGIQDPTHPALAYAWIPALVPIRVVFGSFANRAYLRRAVRRVVRARAVHPGLNKRVLELRARGGTSGWGLALGILISLASWIWSIASRLAAA